MIQLIQYEGNTVKLEHGGVTISTSKSLATRSRNSQYCPECWCVNRI